MGLRLAPLKPDWSHRAFAREWDRYLKDTAGMTAGELVDRLRDVCVRQDPDGVARKVTPPTIYNWRRGVGRPRAEEAREIAKVLGCAYEDLSA